MTQTWTCPRCFDVYVSPLPVSLVICEKGHPKIAMREDKPDDKQKVSA